MSHAAHYSGTLDSCGKSGPWFLLYTYTNRGSKVQLYASATKVVTKLIVYSRSTEVFLSLLWFVVITPQSDYKLSSCVFHIRLHAGMPLIYI